MQRIIYKDLGLIDFKKCWDYQHKLFNEIVHDKLLSGKKGISCCNSKNYLLFCEHPHVYTMGKNGRFQHLLASPEELKQKGIDFYHINRGGDVTYHGPGQLVGYPILDLELFFTDIGKYLRMLEEAVICTLSEYGLPAGRMKKMTGVWLHTSTPHRASKICAIGIYLSRWVTMHGFAFNINTDLAYYSGLIPCGIADKQVTSLQKELGMRQDLNDVKEKLKTHLCELFEMETVVCP